MDPNDPPNAPFSSQPLPDPTQTHVCKDGRCVIMYSGGVVTPKSLKAIEGFLERRGPKAK